MRRSQRLVRPIPWGNSRGGRGIRWQETVCTLPNTEKTLGPKCLGMHQRPVEICKRTCSKLEVYASYHHRCDLPAGSYTRCGARENWIASITCSAANRRCRNGVTGGAHALTRDRWTAKLFNLQKSAGCLRHIGPRRRAADQTDPLDCAQLSGSQRGSKAASAVGEGEVQNWRPG